MTTIKQYQAARREHREAAIALKELGDRIDAYKAAIFRNVHEDRPTEIPELPSGEEAQRIVMRAKVAAREARVCYQSIPDADREGILRPDLVS